MPRSCNQTLPTEFFGKSLNFTCIHQILIFTCVYQILNSPELLICKKNSICLFFQKFLLILHDGICIIFCVNNYEERTEVLSNNVDLDVCTKLWSTSIVELVEESMNPNIPRGKLDIVKWEPQPIEVKGTSANFILPAMSFLESYNGSMSMEITETVSVFWLDSFFASCEMLSNLSLLFLFAVMVY